MKHFKNRFQVNQTITQYRNEEPIRKGVVVAGPFRVENIDHYHVKWQWEHKDHVTPANFKNDIDLICDMTSLKYYYN
jgi:hypothetical protein